MQDFSLRRGKKTEDERRMTSGENTQYESLITLVNGGDLLTCNDLLANMSTIILRIICRLLLRLKLFFENSAT